MDRDDEVSGELYDALRAIAGRAFRGQPADHTLAPTALVHEAWLKLEGAGGWTDRAHFLAAGARAMKQVLVDHARRRGARKRGGDWRRVTLSGRADSGVPDACDLLALDEVLARLDERQARIVELRFFAGLDCTEIARVVGRSRRTVELDLHMARAWLARELDGEASEPERERAADARARAT